MTLKGIQVVPATKERKGSWISESERMGEPSEDEGMGRGCDAGRGHGPKNAGSLQKLEKTKQWFLSRACRGEQEVAGEELTAPRAVFSPGHETKHPQLWEEETTEAGRET